MLPRTLSNVTLETDVERLIVLRKKLNLKQYEFAKELGISTNYLVAVENYRLPFTPKLKNKVNYYLNKVETEKSIYGKSPRLFE